MRPLIPMKVRSCLLSSRKSAQEECGQALVEAGLTLLVFFVFLVSLFEGGRLLQTQQTLTEAAREGARYAVLPLTQTSTLPDCAQVAAHGPDLPSGLIDRCPCSRDNG